MGLPARRRAEKARQAPGTAAPSMLPPPTGHPAAPTAAPWHPPTWYLPLAPKSSPSFSQVTMGLGFPNAMQVRVTLLPSFASTYCGGVSVKVGGAAGHGRPTVTPPFHPWVWGEHGDPGGHATHPKGEGGCRDGDNSGCPRGCPRGRPPRAPPPRRTAPQPRALSGARPHVPTTSHVNSLLSKRGKTPQCRWRGSFLPEERGWRDHSPPLSPGGC